MSPQGLNQVVGSGVDRDPLKSAVARQLILASGLQEFKVDAGSLEDVSLTGVPGDQQERHQADGDDAVWSLAIYVMLKQKQQTYLIQFMFSAVTGYAVGMQ